MKFKVGDTVIVNTGKDKGKSGTVSRIFKKRDLILVEGLNKKIKHVKGREGKVGERVEFFAPLPVSNLSIQDPKTKKPSRIGYKIEADGTKVRFAKKSGEVLVKASSKKEKVRKVVKA